MSLKNKFFLIFLVCNIYCQPTPSSISNLNLTNDIPINKNSTNKIKEIINKTSEKNENNITNIIENGEKTEKIVSSQNKNNSTDLITEQNKEETQNIITD